MLFTPLLGIAINIIRHRSKLKRIDSLANSIDAQLNEVKKMGNIDKINFDTTAKDHALIVQIVDKAEDLATIRNINMPERMTLIMDLSACHLNGCELDLEALNKATPGNLMHDVMGIHHHINRDTGKLENFFLPRFAFIESMASAKEA